MMLQNFQSEFAEYLLSDDEYASLIQPEPNLAIYRNNMLSTLVNALQDIYPLVTKLVGSDFFRVAAKEYIRRYPSRSSNLHDYGEYFSDFLAEYQPVKTLIYLPEVAKFEWLCHTLSFAADHALFDIKLLENINPDQYSKLHFILHPASHLMKFHYPILRIIDLCKGELDETIDLSEGGIHLLIIRRDMDISLMPLSLVDAIFLHALHESQSLSDALDAAILVDADFSLEEKLPKWIKDKTIVDCYVSS
jgi:hypothetical protein